MSETPIADARPTMAVLKAHQDFIVNKGIPCRIYTPGKPRTPENLLGTIYCKKNVRAFQNKLDEARRVWRRNNSHPGNKPIPDADDRPLIEEASIGTHFTGAEGFLQEDGTVAPDNLDTLRALFKESDYVREQAAMFHNDEQEWLNGEKEALQGNSPKS